MRICILTLCSATLAVSLHAAAQPPAAVTQATAIVPFVDNNTFAVARFDLSEPECEDFAFMLTTAQLLLDLKNDLNVKEFREIFTSLRTLGAKDLYVVYSLGAMPYTPVFVIPLPEGSKAKEMTELFDPAGSYLDVRAEKIGAALVFGNEFALQQVHKLKPAPRPEFKAFATGLTLHACISFSPDARRAFEELIPKLPDDLGGGPSTAVTRDLQLAVVTLSSIRLTIDLQATDETAAGKIKGLLGTVLEGIATVLKRAPQDARTTKRWEDFDRSVAMLPQQLGFSMDRRNMSSILGPLVQISEFEVDRKMVAASLKRIAIAMHRHNDVQKTFPTPANYDPQGKPLLSWRIHLLPWMGQEKLYKEFKLNEPWDSAHNKKLIAKMPAVYRHPLGKGVAEGRTAFVVPIGKDTIFPGGKGISDKEITNGDGMSLTVLVFEAADDSMVIWTQPEDWQFDPKQPHRGLVDKSRQSFLTAFADASVHEVKNEISAATLNAIITRNGGESLGEDFEKMVKGVR